MLAFTAIVGMRAIAQYGPASKQNLPKGQFGPLFILANGFIAFFALSLAAARGGTWAKVAAAGGLIIDVALLLKSMPYLEALAAVYEEPRRYAPLNLTGSYQAAQASPGPLPKPPGTLLTGSRGRVIHAKLLAASSPSAAKAMAYARNALRAHGLSGSQWGDLVALWNRESGWRSNAVNPSSGATGIPQLLPSVHKIPPNWSDYRVQINWGLDYIKRTYGSIAAAWAHEQHFGWY